MDGQEPYNGPAMDPLKARAGRRDVLQGGLAALGAGLLPACASRQGSASGSLTVYAPAPPTTPLHALNLQLAEAAAGWPGLPPMQTVPVALPQSVNDVVGMKKRERALHLPIVTTADFRLARSGSGPDWHAYPVACPDLYFVAKLYDVGFGIQVLDNTIRTGVDLKGKRIAAPPRPSAVRMMTEALIGPGWGLDGEVEILGMSPPDALRAMVSGDVDGIAWNLVLPRNAGMAPMLPSPETARFLPVAPDVVAHMNEAYGFALGHLDALPGQPPLISFAQALAAWEETLEIIVRKMLACIAARGADFAGLPSSRATMRDWPSLTAEEIHPAARNFYRG